MKAIFVLFMIVFLIGMAMVEALPAPEPNPSIAHALANGADAIVDGAKKIFS